jgi:hypothetical protein
MKDMRRNVPSAYSDSIRPEPNHHQPINVPTAGAQAFLMDHT